MILICLISCQSGRKDQPNSVAVTILPQQYFAERIAGDKFDIVCMVPSGSSPETYEPAPAQLMKLSDTKAYLQIGYIGFELAWMDKLKETNPGMLVVNTSEGIRLLESDHVCMHDHEAAHDHDHGNSAVDPHTWSSPKNASVIANNMKNTFIRLDPANELFYSKNCNELLTEIHQTDSLLQEIFSKTRNKAFVIYHPALTYLAHDYGLTQISIEHGGKEPSPMQLKSLIDQVNELNVKVIFVQKEFDERNAEIIAKETGCKIVSINPLAYDWKTEMLTLAEALNVE